MSHLLHPELLRGTLLRTITATLPPRHSAMPPHKLAAKLSSSAPAHALRFLHRHRLSSTQTRANSHEGAMLTTVWLRGQSARAHPYPHPHRHPRAHMQTCARTRTHAHAHTRTRTRAHTHTHTHMHTYTHTHTYTCAHTHKHKPLHAHAPRIQASITHGHTLLCAPEKTMRGPCHSGSSAIFLRMKKRRWLPSSSMNTVPGVMQLESKECSGRGSPFLRSSFSACIRVAFEDICAEGPGMGQPGSCLHHRDHVFIIGIMFSSSGSCLHLLGSRDHVFIRLAACHCPCSQINMAFSKGFTGV